VSTAADGHGEAIPKLTKAFARSATQRALEKLRPGVQLPVGPSGIQRDKPGEAGYTEGLAWHVETAPCQDDEALTSRYRVALVCPADVIQHERFFETETAATTGPCPTGELAALAEPGINCDHWATREQTYEAWRCPEVFIFGPHHGQEHHGSTKVLDVELPGGAANWFISVLVKPPVSSRTCPNETEEMETLTWADGSPTRTFHEGEPDPYVA
jgi:hypothetical protein